MLILPSLLVHNYILEYVCVDHMWLTSSARKVGHVFFSFFFLFFFFLFFFSFSPRTTVARAAGQRVAWLWLWAQRLTRGRPPPLLFSHGPCSSPMTPCIYIST